MKIATPLFCFASVLMTLAACGESSTQGAPPSTPAPPAASSSDATGTTTAATTANPPGQPQGVPEGATPPDGQKVCTCKLSSLEACHPNCKPHRWFAADCDKQRPKACLKD